MMKEKGFYRGVNFGGWLSQCDYSQDRLDNFITEDDFRRVSEMGLDHVRVPIDYNVLEMKDGFDRVEKAVLLAKKYGLNIVIDLHKTAGFSFDAGESEEGFFDSEKYQEQFYVLWEKIAERFGKYSDCAAFELLNEVTDKSFIGVWNSIIQKCIERIRAYAPDTLILVGSYWNNSAEAVKDLDKPYDDKVVYNFHCYAPLDFTHQGAFWIYDSYFDKEKRISFDESETSPELFEKLFLQAIEKAKAEGTDVYCGEYGVIENVSPEDTVKWFRTINGVFEKYGIARSVWSYKEMNFGLTDSRLDGVRDELIKYL